MSDSLYWREYDLKSSYPDYNTIKIPRLPVIPGKPNCLISVSSVTFTNAIRTLCPTDYIIINDIKYMLSRELSNLSPESFVVVLSELFDSSSITVSLKETKIIRFISTDDFIINDMSYNMSRMIGIEQNRLPLQSSIKDQSHTYQIIADQYGDYNSTPIFYLLSNIGVNGSGSGIYIQRKYEESSIMESHQIFMRINNSWCPNLPVTFVGGDIKYYSDSKVLNSTEWIKIVDAELQPLDLLYPMRVSIRVEFLDENN